jgi:hypothetical protein
MMNKDDVLQVFDGIKETMEDMEDSIKELLRMVPRQTETLIDPETNETRQSEDTDEELLSVIEDDHDDIRDGLQALWVALNSYVEDTKKEPK